MILCVLSAFQNGQNSHKKNGPQLQRSSSWSGTAFPGACAVADVPSIGLVCTRGVL